MADLTAGMAKMGIQIQPNIPPPANLRNTRDGLTGIFLFEIRPPTSGGAVVHRYDVEIVELGRNKSLTTGGDDGKKHLKRNICFELIDKLKEMTNGFGEQAMFVYDCRKNLFTNKRILPQAYEIAADQMSQQTQAYLRKVPVKIEIKPCQTGRHELDLNELKSSMSSRLDEQSDHAVRTFLEMLTAQSSINAKTHDIIGNGLLFDRQIVKQLEDGVVTRHGMSKGVRIIANDGKPKAALVADVKTCAFFNSNTLDKLVQQMLRKRRIDANNNTNWDHFASDFNKMFRGVSGYLTYDPSRIIVIDSITQRSVNEFSFEVGGNPIKMVDFFAQKKKVRVNGCYPAVRQQNDQEVLFPMETIMILPNQRVPIEKMSDFISRELLNANTTFPDKRYAEIESAVKKIATGESAAFMAQFGVKLKGGNNEVKIGIHDPIKVKFGNNIEATFKDKIAPGVRFFEPSTVLKDWAVAFPNNVQDKDVRAFIDQLIRMGKQRGMTIPEPKIVGGVGLDQLGARIQEFAKQRGQFLMYIDSKTIKSHDPLKLEEKRYGLLTQHVTIEVASKARVMTLSNILNKMNMKLFGQNYIPILPLDVKAKFPLDSGEVLVIGLDTSLPPPSSAFEKHMMKQKGLPEGLKSEEPMIVGICANYSKDPHKFCGDYYYQPCLQDVLDKDALEYKLNWVLKKMMKSRNKLPSIVFIIRDGISEGQIPNNILKEYPSYVNACRKFGQEVQKPDWRPKFVYGIVDKGHNKRFFLKGANGQAENTVPGCSIDSKFVRVDMHEFWMQAHIPLKGTAKIPQYVFPVNEINAGNKELQGFILALCCSWQIVNLAPALPTPVRQAAELAKRGLNNFLELKHTPQFIPRIAGTQQIDYSVLNNRLCYNGHPLSNTRFNA